MRIETNISNANPISGGAFDAALVTATLSSAAGGGGMSNAPC
jgi:hypothetical protein